DDVEEIILRGRDPPVDREVDVHDVLVARQHQAFFGIVADPGLVDAVDRHDNVALDRVGQPDAEARILGVVELAEAQHDGAFLFVHLIDAGEKPADHRDGEENQKAGRTEAATAAATGAASGAATVAAPAPEPVLHPAKGFFEVRAVAAGFAAATAAGAAATPGTVT